MRILWRTMKWGFIVLCIFMATLFFRSQRLPMFVVNRVVGLYMPENLVVHLQFASFGFCDGLFVRGLRVFDRQARDPLAPLLSAETIRFQPFQRCMTVCGLKYSRLPESYYAEGNTERQAEVDLDLPDFTRLTVVLERPEILGVKAERVVADVVATDRRLTVDRFRLDWPDADDRMSVDGSCDVDLVRQRIRGSVTGLAKQVNIRPLLETLDLSCALPYVDAFTEVKGPVPATCGWTVNLMNNDFDMDLGLHPGPCRYNGVPMKGVDGKIALHVFTRGDHLNYTHVIGPISGVGFSGQPLDGTVWVSCTNGESKVDVESKSLLSVAELLKIGGFTGDYVGENVYGTSSCRLSFRFKRSQGRTTGRLNGDGHISIVDGQVMRMKGFSGLLELLADKVPGFSLLTDSTQASCDYTISDGVLKSDNIYIEGSVFSIKMYGTFDTENEKLDFTVRVQFTKKDSLAGKLLHPLTWPFTKLLLEFRLHGTPDKPRWDYVSIIDRVMEIAK